MQGIAHPPDIGTSLPVSYREYMPIEAQNRCSMVMLPVIIPCSVEGVIPRIWAIQRRVADALDGVLPNSLRIWRLLCKFFAISSHYNTNLLFVI